MRLFALSSILIIAFLPLSIYVFYSNFQFGIVPYSWTRVHDPEQWGMIDIFATNGEIFYDRWFRIAAAFISFAFFGLGDDAVNMYKGWLAKIGLGYFIPSIRDSHSNATVINPTASTSKKNPFFKALWRNSTIGSVLPLRSSTGRTRTSIGSDATVHGPDMKRDNSIGAEAKMPLEAALAMRRGDVVVRHQLWEEESAASPVKMRF